MPRVPQSDHLPLWMKQKRTYGCIPTNLAAILHSFDVTSQRIARGGYVTVDSVDEELLLELLYVAVHFKMIERSGILPHIFQRNGRPVLKLEGPDAFSSFNEWWEAVTGHIARGSYVLISYGGPVGAHIVTAYQVENDVLTVYNPDPSETAQTSLGKSQLDGMWNAEPKLLNGDILIVSKV